MITNTIRAQYRDSSTISLMYSKPYTKNVDNMRMPNGYQPPKFMQFDGKVNPKQHIAHFLETCENVRTQGDLLTSNLFVLSKKVPLIGTQTWSLSQFIVGSNLKESFLIDSIAHVAW